MDQINNQEHVSKSNILIIAVMLSGAFIAVLNQTVISPALPSIMKDLNITANGGQWLTTAFMLVNGIMIPITAFLINRFSTRKLFIVSMAFFTVGTTLAAIAPSFSILLVGRIIQAVGAGILMPMIQTVILLLFPKEKRGSAMGVIGIVMAFAPAIGPTLAGFIVDTWGWNAIFALIAPIAAVDVLCAVFLLRNVGEQGYPRLDVLSVMLSSLGFGGLLYGCSSAGGYGWLHPLTLVPLLVGAVCLFLFFRRQLHLEEPLLEIKIFKSKVFTYSTVIGMIVNASLVSSGIITPIYLQNILHYSATLCGLIMLPGAILMGIMSPVAGYLFDRFGPRVLSLTGLTVMTVGTFLFLFLDVNCSFIFLCSIYTLRMFGISILNMPLMTWGLNALDNRLISHGSAISNTMRQVAGSIGTAILITVMTTATQSKASLGFVESTLFGIHTSFGVATGLSAVALILGIIGVRQSSNRFDD